MMAEINSMQYRKLTAEEKFHVARQQMITWPQPGDSEVSEDKLREKISGGEGSYGFMDVYGIVDGAGHVLGGMNVEPFTMWFDGQRVPMAGIAGVVSLPEYRRSGNIRSLFSKIFEDMHDNGTVFSHLFPFSYDYYRKFGYDHCGSAVFYTLPVAEARKLPADGTAHEFIKGDDVHSTLLDIYEQFASRHNLMLSRPEYRLKNLFDVTLLSPDRLYYWRDTSGKIKAWVKYKKDGKTLAVSDIVWADYTGMLGILRFLGMYDGAAEEISFRSSPEFTAELYWGDPYNVNIENNWLGMNRVVNARRALELMRKPQEGGEFTISITDSFAPWNTGTYAVSYGESTCHVKKSGKTTTPDIEASERSFMQMALGVYDLRTLAAKGDIEVNGDIKKLEKVFHKKPLLITDFF